MNKTFFKILNKKIKNIKYDIILCIYIFKEYFMKKVLLFCLLLLCLYSTVYAKKENKQENIKKDKIELTENKNGL